jgi:hypothetical protein
MQIRTFSLRIFLILVLLPFLGGCATPYIFGPAKVGSSDHSEFKDESKKGGLGGDATDKLYSRGTESVMVGWEHFFERYDDFYVRISNHIYRGGVNFNVGLLSEPPAKTVTKATLKYTIQEGAKSPTSAVFIESCATKLLLAKDDWHGIPEVDIPKAPDTISGDLYKGGLSESPLGSVISIDVTDVVKAWAAGTKTNFGFVFAGSTEEKGLPMNNDKCWTLLGDFTLTVDYTKP